MSLMSSTLYLMMVHKSNRTDSRFISEVFAKVCYFCKNLLQYFLH